MTFLGANSIDWRPSAHPVSACTGQADTVFSLFLVLSAVVAIMFDGQNVLPRDLYPASLRKLQDWYVYTTQDPLALHLPGWFRFMTWIELCVQVPFWLVAAFAYARGLPWIRQPVIYWGIFQASVIVPMLGEFLVAPASSRIKRWQLIGAYLPFAVVPLIMAARMLGTLQQGHAAFPQQLAGRAGAHAHKAL